MPDYVVHNLVHALNDDGKPLKNSTVLILGAAYKNDVDDMRESPSLKLIEILREHGAKVQYHDPYVPVLPPTRKYRYKMKSTPLTAANLKKADAVLIATAHQCVDYDAVAKHASLVVDTRNAMKSVKKSKARIVRT